MGVHARLSASSAHRWLVCPGSVRLSGGSSTTLAAAQGTVAHEIAAQQLKGDGYYGLGAVRKWDGHDVEVTQEMLDAVQVYVDYVQSDHEPGDQEWVEMSVFKGLQKIDPDLGGTADHVRYRPSTKHLFVTDFKHGSGVYVDAEANPQTMLYGLGALLELNLPVREVTLTICQPRFEGAEPIRSWTFLIEHILEFVHEVTVRASLTRDVGTPLVSGEHCKFCPAARTCPALEKQHHALIVKDFLLPAGEELARAMRSIGPLKERIKAIEEHAYAEACRGVAIPGYKLVDKRPVRRWIREADVIEWAQRSEIDPYAPRELLSPAQLEEKLYAAAPRGKKKHASIVLAPFIKAESSGTALVPVDDNRPAVTKVSVNDFPIVDLQVIEGTVEKKEAVPLSLLP